MADFFAARKRARQARAQETEEVILEAANRLVQRDGDTGFSTNRIAEVAGVSVGSLYQYFPGKDAILHALVKREFNRTVDGHVRHIESLDTSRLSLEEAVASIVDHVFDSQSRSRPLYRRLALSVLSIRHLSFTLDNDARVLEAVRRKLSAYGEATLDGLDSALFVTLYTLKGVQIGMVLSGRPNDDRALRAALTRSVLAAIAPGRLRSTENKSGTDSGRRATPETS